ncbi:hypothetical protein MED15_03813 [Micromonospora noduli]|uniref:Fibronectin type-III domain-containing protein n=1 Tax=Micromonospora noduli TaxID=709876 RepID=A0ABX9D1C8_9ACTN|nr:hypothetical protein [Micromonospora noduli]RAO16294.1 hypothetical protein MED15_03813 [Micromonospora noduli]
MAFDQRTYLREVIGPLRDRPGGLSPTDLARHYAVSTEMSAAELREQLTVIRRLWNQRSSGVDSAARVCAQLHSRDEQLRAEHGTSMFEPSWWRERIEEHGRGARAESERFARDLAQSYGALGRITQAQLKEIAGHWPGLDAEQIDQAVRRAGLVVVDPVELPTEPDMERTAYRSLLRLQDLLGAPTVVQVVHPDGAPFRLLGAEAVPLDVATVRARTQEANRLADAAAVRNRKEALGLLERAATDGVDLRLLALFQVVDRLRSGRARGLADGMLVRIATDTGLEHSDARSVVANLPLDTGQDAGPAGRIRDLVADGHLLAARQAVAVLPLDDPHRDELRGQVDTLLGEVESLRRAADEATRSEREEEAARLLRSALRIAADDDDLADRLAALAPPPPRGLAARSMETGVRLTWTAPPGQIAEVRYRVVRSDRPPRSAADGETVSESTLAEATDPAAPPARSLHYGVFASVGGDWSRPATVATRIVPPVTGVRVSVRPDELSCSWRAHPAAEGVRVRRTLGRPPASAEDGEPVPASRAGLSDDTGDGVTDRYYGIVPVYRDEHGAEVEGPFVVARAVLRDAAPSHVERLRAHVTAVDAQTATAHFAWLTPAGGTVSVRRSELRPTWAPGARIRREEMEGYGEALVSDRIVQEAETLLEVTVPSGRFVYVPFTVDRATDTAVVGEPLALGVTEPVQQLIARRTGDEVTVAWVWPPSVNLAEVTFTPPQGSPTVRRLTRGQVTASGCRLRVGPAGGRVSVRTVERGPGGETYSAVESVPVDGVPVAFGYRIRRDGGLFSRKRLLSVDVDQPCEGVELLLVAASGVAMPARPERGRVVSRVTGLSLHPDVAWQLPFTLPTGLSKPYWLRCFVIRPPDARVTDPIDEMKVS